MGEYLFYGWEQADVPAITGAYRGIATLRDLYDRLSSGAWCARDLCAPPARGLDPGQQDPGAVLHHGVFGARYLRRTGVRHPPSRRQLSLLQRGGRPCL